MLERISIHNFAVARDVSLEIQPGVTVFTGETGAGKSLIVDALSFAFGARRGREVIATGSERAQVEVTLTGGMVVERAISRAGRSTARIDGSTATIEQLQELGDRIADIHSQSGQLAILRPAVQRDLLDSYAGLAGDTAALGAKVRELREVRRAIRSLTTDTRERERRIDQLRFEVEEIESAALIPGEDDALRQEHARLANSRLLTDACEQALAALESPGIAEAVAAIGDVTARDDSAVELADLAATLEASADELRREVRRYRDAVEEDPERLLAVEERLDLIARLRRKYGDTLEAILAYGQQAADELGTLERSDISLDDLRGRESALVDAIADAAASLSAARRRAARDLVARVEEQLRLLGMSGGSLCVGFEAVDDADGAMIALPDFERIDARWEPAEATDPVRREVTESGADRVEFLASFNPGQEPRPLNTVASGGETSRFLLALAAVFSDAADPRTIVLDEVDEGVGGRAGSLVGEALRRLGRRHQVLCITHLPQVAAYGDQHLVVRKHTDGKSTWSSVESAEGEARVEEVASMLGGISDATKEAARDLLAAASRAPAGADA